MLHNKVFKTNNLLFNSITQKSLPLNASVEILRDNLFLENQVMDAVKAKLISMPKTLKCEIITTWECNLRCSHCCVMKYLKKKDPDELNIEKLVVFFNEYLKKFDSVDGIGLSFIGGESFLRSNKILECINVTNEITKKYKKASNFSATTNLSYDLDLEKIEIFEKLTQINISIDGLEKEHNQQRYAFSDKSINPFQKTIKNLSKLISLGFRDKINIQAALKSDLTDDFEYLVDFSEYLTKIGVIYEKIHVGSIFPTESRKSPEPSYVNYKKNHVSMHTMPCCKYRMMSNFMICPDGKIYDNFYKQEDSLVGTLDDSIDEIYEKNMRLILDEMPALNDPTCIKCPAIGYCWGGCIAGHVYIGNKPSYHCSKEKLVPFIEKLANDNNLIDFNKNHYLKNLL